MACLTETCVLGDCMQEPSLAERWSDEIDLPKEPRIDDSPSGVESFPGATPPCGTAPTLPALSLGDCAALAGAAATACRVERIIKSRVEGVLSCAIHDTTDKGHVRQGARDGRALAAHGCQLQVSVVATSFRGQKPIARHRAVMACLKDMIDSGEIHSVQVKAKVPPA